MQKKIKKNNKKGFSFLEVMLIIFILGTTLVIFVQVITKSILHSNASRDTIIAAGLAQEGVELVRNIRDNNWAQKSDGFSGASSITNGSWAVSYNGNSLISLGTGKLKLNDEGYYNTSLGNDTKFSRRIDIVGDANAKTITSLVVWERSDFPGVTSCAAANKCAYAEIILTKWGN